MNDTEIVYLDITSWRGISIGAEHYYGKLILDEPFTKKELKRILSAKDAEILNKKDDWDGFREGFETERFDNIDDIIEIAIKQFRIFFPKAKVLLMGNHASRSPKKVLFAPIKIMSKLNKIFEKYDKIEWVERYGFRYRKPEDEQLEDELSDEFDNILRS